MKFFRCLLVSLFGLSISIIPKLARAEEPNPFIFVTVSKVDDLQKVASDLMKIADLPQVQPGIDQLVNQLAIDKTKPLVVTFSYGEQELMPMLWFPTRNADTMIQNIKKNVQTAMEIKKEGQFWNIRTGTRTAFAMEKKGYLIVGRSQKNLKNAGVLPDSVMKLASEYQVATMMDLQRTPDEYKQRFIQGVNNRVQNSKKRNPQETELEFRDRQFATMISTAFHRSIWTEARELTFGVKLTPAPRRLVAELKLTATAGSNLEKQFAPSHSLSRFHYLMSRKSPLSLSFDVKLPSSIREHIILLWDDAKKKASDAAIASNAKVSEKENEALEKMATLIEKYFREGRLHFTGGVKSQTDGKANLYGVVHLKGARNVETLFLQYSDQFGDEEKSNTLPFRLKKKVASRHSLAIHRIEMKQLSPKTARMFGTGSNLFLAFGSDELFFTFGSNGLDTMTKLLDEVHSVTSKPIASVPLFVEIRGKYWMKQIPVNEQFKKIFEKSLGERDRVSFSVMSIPSGVKAQVIFEQDYLKIGAKLLSESIEKLGRRN